MEHFSFNGTQPTSSSTVLAVSMVALLGANPIGAQEVAPSPMVRRIDAGTSATAAQVVHLAVECGGRAFFEPTSALGKRLLALRTQAIADGLKLMTGAQIDAELMEARGERSWRS